MRKRYASTLPILVLAVWVFPGCATCQRDDSALCPLPVVSRPGGLVLVADGAGDFRATSQALQKAVATEKLPLTVETFVWSHGYLRILADQLDQAHSLKEGQRLADHVCACRLAYPDRPIYLVGHSAGCAVVLAAAEALPPDSLDRILLFAPSVPADYDLRPALRSVRQGLDVFCSAQDGWYLKIGLWLTAVTRGRCRVAAGCTGFRPLLESAEDAPAYAKLFHHPWGPRLAWTGHEGGHFGYYQPGYLRGIVLPLLAVKRTGN